MAEPRAYRYDVFISHADADRAWVEGYLLDALEAASVRVHSEEAFRLGVPRILEFERAIRQSQRTLLILSPAHLAEGFSQFTDLLAQSYGLETATWPVIPLILHPVQLPPRLAMLTALDATDPSRHEEILARLCAELARPLPTPAPPPPCPYPGMVPFSEADSDRFFGRDREVQELLERLRLHPFITVIGPSGSGKSSLVFAGLIPALRQSSLFGPGEWLMRTSAPRRVPSLRSWVMGIAFSRDGTRLATASADETAKVWEASSGREVLTLSGHTAVVNGVAFSPDGTRLVTTSRDGVGKVWDAASGQELLTLSGHTSPVFGVAFSPDGSRLATGSDDWTAKVWDAASGQEVLTLRGHTNTVSDVAFSPGGARLATASLATASLDRTAKVWDVVSGRELLTLTGHNGEVYGLAFSPDGERLATASRDGTVRVYALNIADLMALARQRLTRSWRPEECQKYLHQEQCPPLP